MGMAACSVLTSVLVLYCHHFGAVQRPPKVMRYVAFRFLARVLCMKRHVPDDNQAVPVLKGAQKMTPDVELPDMSALNIANDKVQPADVIIRKPCRRSLLGQCANSQDEKLPPPPPPPPPPQPKIAHYDIDSGRVVGNADVGRQVLGYTDASSATPATVERPPLSPRKLTSHHHTERDYIKEILQHIRSMIARTEQRERDDVIIEEWKAIASVLDRSFFFLAFFTIFIVIPILLFSKDTSHD